MKSHSLLSKIFLASLIVVIQISLYCQNQAPAKHWQFTAPCTQQPTFQPSTFGENWFYNIIQTSDGGYLRCGYAEILQQPTDAEGIETPVAVKMDQNGQVVFWEKLFDNNEPGNEGYFSDVVEVPDGYVFEGSKRVGLNQELSVYIVKTDKEGNIIFSKNFGSNIIGGGNSAGAYSSIKADNPSQLSTKFIVGATAFFSNGTSAALLIRIDQFGNLVTAFNSTGWEYFNVSSNTQGRNARVMFESNGDPTFLLVGSVNNGTNEDILTIKVNKVGGVDWSHIFNSSSLSGYTPINGNYQALCSAAMPSCPLNTGNSTDYGFTGERISSSEIMILAHCDEINGNDDNACFLTPPASNNPPYCFVPAGHAFSYQEFNLVAIPVDYTNDNLLSGHISTTLARATGIDFATPMVATPAGNCAVLVNEAYIVGSNPNTQATYGVTNHLIEFDGNGNTLWDKQFQGDGLVNCDWGLGYCPSDGGFIVGGNNELNDEDYLAIKLYGDCEQNAPYDFIATYTGLPQSPQLGYHPNDGTLWDPTNLGTSTYRVKGEIIVDAGVTFTIQGMTIEFADTRQTNDFDYLSQNTFTISNQPTKIIVKPGGRLIVKNSTLKGLSTCGSSNMWQGIEVWGNPLANALTLNNQGYSTVQGTAIFINAVVQDALMGVLANESDFNSAGHPTTDDFPGGGGIIQATGTEFLNCSRSVHFTNYPYSATHPNSTRSFFKACNFRNDAAMSDPDFIIDNGLGQGIGVRVGNNSFASMWNYHGVKFIGTKFECAGTYFTQTNPQLRGQGIVSVDAGYRVVPNVTQPCQFIGLSTAINSMASGPFTSNNIYIAGGSATNQNQFVNNYQAILLRGIDGATVNWNTFSVSTFLPNPPLCLGNCYPVGLYLDACSGYSVQENNYSSLAQPSYGTIVNNSGTMGNEINNNQYNNLYVGTQAQSVNSGLQVKCNQYVAPVSTSDIAVTSGQILNPQGFFTTNDPTKPAGNSFSHDCNTSYGDIYSASPIVYYRHTDLLQTPSCITANVSPVNTFISFVNQQTSCPSQIIACNPPCYQSQISSANNQINTLKALLVAGDAQNLVNIIHNNQASGQVKNTLLAVGPYLSDRVLLAAINEKPSPLPAGTLKDIIIPNSPVSATVLSALQNRVPSLPPGIMNQIMNAQIGTSPRTETELGVNYWTSQKDISVNSLIRYYLNDTTIVNPMDSILPILKSQNLSGSKCDIVAALVGQGLYSAAQIALDSAHPTGVLDNFCKLQQILIQLGQAGQTCLAMKTNPVIKGQIDSIAADSSERGCREAQALLTLVFGTNFPVTIETIPGNNLRSQSPFESETDSQAANELSVYPNPANNSVNISYNLSEESSTVSFTLYNSVGAMVKTFMISGENGIMSIDVSDLPEGIYFYSAIIDKEKALNGKLVIII